MKTELLCDNEMSDKVRSSSKKSHHSFMFLFILLGLGPGGVARPNIRNEN